MTRQPLLIALLLLPTLVWPAPRQDVAIKAYINVSSGCQAATVDFLNGLKNKYAPNVSLEIIDFGDQGAGMRRWQQSGHRCMTIEVNGWALLKYPIQGKTRAIALQMPVGLNWTHTELEQAVQAGLRGELQQATAQEVETYSPPRQLNVIVSTGSITYQGRNYAAVKIEDAVGMAIPITSTQAAALQRAQTVAQSLKAWLAKPMKASELTVKQVTGGWAVMAGSRKIITATAADGKKVGKSAQDLATAWRDGTKYALMQATR